MKQQPIDLFTQNEMNELLDLSFRSLSCRDEAEFISMVNSLKKLFFFESAFCARANLMDLLSAKEDDPVVHLCDAGFPHGFLDLYVARKNFQVDPVLWEFVEKIAPVNWHFVEEKYGADDDATVLANSYNLKDGWTHGVLEPASMNFTSFSFAGQTADRSPRTSHILAYIVPFFSETYRRVLTNTVKSEFNLSRREIEILNWIKEGKSSWEISQIFNCSKRTVDFHFDNIRKKLGASSRAHTVAIAMHHGIIGF